jgi:fatty acid desaturase
LGNVWLLILLPAVLWTAVMAFFLGVPDSFYRKSLVKPDVHPRWTSAGRLTFTTGVFTALVWLTLQTGEPWAVYYFLLWLVPIGTTFSFFMILRQIVQHGNAGGGRLTNTRIFHVGRLIQLAVFPLGMDYHLPHHMYPMVPHHRLRCLHALLLETEPYRRRATHVDGYFFHHERPPVHPTVLDLMAEPPAHPETD